MAKYNSAHDIPYLLFHEFSKEIKDHATDHVLISDKVIEYFYPEVTDNEVLYVEEFSMALNKDFRKFIPYRIDLKQLNKTSNFIDADTFRNENDIENLFKIIVKSWVPFRKVDVQKISLSDGQKIVKSFLKEQSRLSNLFNISLIRQIRLQLMK